LGPEGSDSDRQRAGPDTTQRLEVLVSAVTAHHILNSQKGVEQGELM
jgi:hypothetical protein